MVATLLDIFFGGALLLAQRPESAWWLSSAESRCGIISTASEPGSPPLSVWAIGLDAEPDPLYRLHLGLSLSPSLASILSGAVISRGVDIESNMVVLGSLHRMATTSSRRPGELTRSTLRTFFAIGTGERPLHCPP